RLFGPFWAFYERIKLRVVAMRTTEALSFLNEVDGVVADLQALVTEATEEETRLVGEMREANADRPTALDPAAAARECSRIRGLYSEAQAKTALLRQAVDEAEELRKIQRLVRARRDGINALIAKMETNT
ncbi:MAG: hypothetical protein KJ749_03705, partial [Planctomycetes bacterium]|nr:hypothetical protein [Planctomycetota bacterium]